MHRVAVIQFPGSNCEYETQRAVQAVGLEAEIFRWNGSEADFHAFDAYVLPGGFSYQDRVRAGAIAAKLPILSYLVEADLKGKPILGICNGCQILAESGLVPNSDEKHQIKVALGHNLKDDHPIGFICDWVYVQIHNADQNVFLRSLGGQGVLPIPINHGEGRFVLEGDDDLKEANLAYMTYCDDTGAPVNPNGAFSCLAAMSNRRGNVLAMMPHPERATFLKQVPGYLRHPMAEKKRRLSFGATGDELQGPFWGLFESLKEHLALEHAIIGPQI